MKGNNMMMDDYKSLNEILQELRQEEYEVKSQIQYNLRCIKETETYVDDFMKSETEDFKVFSPRKAEIIHKEEIEKAKEKKSFYEECNKELSQKKGVLNSRINKIESILNHQSRNFTFLKVQEEERQRIARELHDTSLQNLAHMIHKLELSSMYIDKDPIQAKLELTVVSKCLRETIDEIRSTIFDLRPMTFDDLGLKAALERLLVKVNEDGKYEIISQISDLTCKSNLILLSLYRIVQESFCNIVKHADADKIIFHCVEEDGMCVLTIEDNGKGFCQEYDDGRKHFGISLMRERVDLLNGKINIVSTPGKGTRVVIKIPLDVLV